jgi:tetratricopeptide (TPR) repeat protein
MESSEILKKIKEIYKQADAEKQEWLAKVGKVFEGLNERDRALMIAANIDIIKPPTRLSTRLETYRRIMDDFYRLETREGVSPIDNELEAERVLLEQTWWGKFVEDWKEKWSIYNENDIGLWGWRYEKLQPYVYEFGYFYQTPADYKSSGPFKPTMRIGHVGPRRFVSWRIDIKSNKVTPIAPPASDQLEGGLALASRGRNEEAIIEFTRYIKMKLNDSVAYVVRGDSYDDMGQSEKAIEDYSKSIELEPMLAEAYDKRGVVYAELGDFEKSIKDFNKAVELYPENAKYYFNRSITHDNSGNVDKAIDDCTKAIELNENYAEAIYNRGVAYSEKGEYDEAISDYDKAIKLKPAFLVDIYFNRGLAYQAQGQYKKALEDFKWARKNVSEPGDIETIEQKIRELTRR